MTTADAADASGVVPTPTPSTSDPAPGRQYPLWPLAVMALVSLIDQIDVSVARGILPILQDEWDLSDTQVGLTSSVFVFVSAIATIPAGYVADRVRRTKVVGWTLLSWSGLILLSATAVNYVNFLGARALMGIGQAVDDPASTSYLADSYPSRMRARVFSWQQSSFFIGAAIGLGIAASVGGTFGWRWALASVSIPGALVAITVFRLREPRRGEAELPETMSWEEVEALPPRKADGATGTEGMSVVQFLRLAATELWAEMKMIFGIRTMRYVLVGVAALLFTTAAIGTWLPFYYERYADMTEAQAVGVTAGVLGIGGLIGTVLGGRISDKYHHRWKGGRIVLVVWSAGTCAVLFMVSFAVPVVGVRMLLQFLGVLAAAGAAPGLRAAMTDVVPAESRGVGASAMALATAVFGNALAPSLVGWISDATGSLLAAFYIVFPPVLFGLMFLYRARHTLEDDAQAIVIAIYEENQLLEAERVELGLMSDGTAPDDPSS